MDIDVSVDEFTGGWFVAQIMMIDEVGCPTILTNENASKIVITPKFDGLDINPVRETIKINAVPRSSTSGTSYHIKAKFEVNTQNKDIDSYFNACIHKKVVLFAQKNYGQQIMFGSPTCPLSFSYKSIHGTKMEDGSAFEISVSGKIPQKPVYL